jgi:hypothetical protein
MKSTQEIRELLQALGKPGHVSKEALAFALHVKKTERLEKGMDLNAFAMQSDEIDALGDIIADLISDCKNDFRFQIAYAHFDNTLNHWSFLEFDFKGSEEPPALNILVCDPLGLEQSTVLATRLSNTLGFGFLSEHCNLTVFLATDTLQQSGKTCPYFTLDSIAMLSNQDEFVSTYEYMREHQDQTATNVTNKKLDSFREAVSYGAEPEDLNNIFNFKVIVSELPVRLARTKHDVEALQAQSENNTQIVNHKQHSFARSVQSRLIYVEDRYKESSLRNLRTNLKMKKWEERVTSLQNQDLSNFEHSVSTHSLEGLAGAVREILPRTLTPK